MRLLIAAAVLAVVTLPGCLGSEKTYRPYKGEARPAAVEGSDPVEAQVQLKYGVPHDILEHNTFIEQARKANREVLTTVHRNDDGSPRNAWLAYEDDFDRVLGKDVLKHHAPRAKAKPDRPEPKKKEGEEGEGGDKPEKGDKGDKPEGGDKPEKSGE
jgi:hypothetical protein